MSDDKLFATLLDALDAIGAYRGNVSVDILVGPLDAVIDSLYFNRNVSDELADRRWREPVF